LQVSLFTENKTGRLVKINNMLGEEYSFLPDDLPTEWSWSNNIWKLLAEATAALGSLNGAGKYLPNPRLLLSPLQRREALISSRLEGTYTDPEQQLLFDFDIFKKDQDEQTIENLKEVSNYRKALNYYFESKDKLPISKRLIRSLHKILLDSVRGGTREPGSFRKVQVMIGRPARFIPPPPHLYNQLLNNLEEFIHTKKDIHPLIEAFLVHYQFEAIHPFRDGNGRVGRIMLAIMIAEGCNLSHSWLYMSPYFDANRDEYIDRLFRVSADGQWEEWIEFCLRGVVQQAKDAEERFVRLMGLSKEFKERINRVGGSHRLYNIVDDLFIAPVIQTASHARQHDIAYNTAKQDIHRLIQVGILSKSESMTRPVTYVSDEILRIIFEGII